MKRPIGLPEEYVVLCEEANDGQDLFQRIIKRETQQIVTFFYCAADDHTWIENSGGKDYIVPMLKWLTEKFLSGAISKPLAVRICTICQENYKALSPYLPKDITFIAEGKRMKGNSLLFRIAGGEYFSELIDEYIIGGEQEEIDLPFTTAKVFKKVREFIYTGEIQNLWKDEPQNIYAVIEQANKWGLKALSDLGFKTFRNYLEKETFIQRLAFALNDRLPALTEEMCKVVNKEHMGFRLDFERFDKFGIEIMRVWDEYEPFLYTIAPYITHIECHDLSTNQETLLKFLPKCRQIQGIDFSQTESTETHRFIQILDELKPFSISYCNFTDLEWIDDILLKEIFDRIPQVIELVLARVSHLTYRGYSELANLKSLDNLDLTFHVRLSDDDLGIVAETLPNLRVLNLSSCQKLTDKALTHELQHLQQLEELHLSQCQNFSPAALLSLKGLPKLRRLFLQGTQGVGEELALKIKRSSALLQEVVT